MKEVNANLTVDPVRSSSRRRVLSNGILLFWTFSNLVMIWQLHQSTKSEIVSLQMPCFESKSPRRRPKSIQWNATVDHNNNQQHRDHPHAGARDENGAWNYVPDVTALRRRVLQHIQKESTRPNDYLPLEFNSTVCDVPPGMDFEGPDGYKALREYIQVDGPYPVPDKVDPAPDVHELSLRDGYISRWKNATALRDEMKAVLATSPPRILCAIYTHQPSHGRVKDIADTWGWRCDGFFAASTQTNRTISAVDLPHKGPEHYGNMWQKTRSMVAFMYDYYLDDYDYFLLCGDDTYIIVENLRNYLVLLESTTAGRNGQPLFIGASIALFDVYYNTGGPSYILNAAALRQLVEVALPHYFRDVEHAGEDVLMGVIMSALSIPQVDTSDVSHRQRFFHDAIRYVASEHYNDMYNSYTYQYGRRAGSTLISTQSIGFHLVESVKRFHAILYNTCPVGTALGDAAAAAVANIAIAAPESPSS